MHKESQYTKWKIIIGYSLIIILSVISAILIYKQIIRFTINEGHPDNVNQKLFIISNTITGLYEAEALSSAFTQTGNQNYFRKFTAIIQETKENIDTLRALSHQTDQRRI